MSAINLLDGALAPVTEWVSRGKPDGLAEIPEGWASVEVLVWADDSPLGSHKPVLVALEGAGAFVQELLDLGARQLRIEGRAV